MFKKQAGELKDNNADANELFAKGASVKLLASKADVGSKELSKVSQNFCVLVGIKFSFRKLQLFCLTLHPK